MGGSDEEAIARIGQVLGVNRSDPVPPVVAFQYGQVEAAIAEVLGIKARGFGALRARLRHMRNIGVPELPRPGSGQKITYSKSMALEMLLTVTLERGGFTPRIAALAGPRIASVSWNYHPDQGEDVFVIVGAPDEEEKGGLLYWAKGGRQLLVHIESHGLDSFFVMNVSALLRKLNKALED